MCVRSPKTEHHAGKGYRFVPLFPELRPHLEEAFERAEEGSEFVISRYRSQDVNLRTQLLRIVKRAGLESWPKLWQNLRSTRETELAERFPLHVVCKWIGNTQPVAAKHYLQVTDEHFRLAVESDVESDAVKASEGGNRRNSPTLRPAASGRTKMKNPRPARGLRKSMRDGAAGCSTSECPGEDSNLHGRKNSH